MPLTEALQSNSRASGCKLFSESHASLCVAERSRRAVALKRCHCAAPHLHSRQRFHSSNGFLYRALNTEFIPEPVRANYQYRWLAPLSLAPAALALLTLAIRGISEVACVQANSIATLTAALLFLFYFASTLARSSQPLASRIASALRPAQDGLVHGCALATAAQLATAACLCLSFPPHAEGALVPLYAAGYLCVAILAASQHRRPLKGRLRFEIEAGEGERHSVMAQGTRLAARNYAWLILTLHLWLQAAAHATAAAAAASKGAAAVAAPGASWPLAVTYGTLAVLYVVVGAVKFAHGANSGGNEDGASGTQMSG